jgi:predicted O-methyltransferase YrrM
MNFSLKRISQYCIQHSTIPSDILHQLERETHLKTLAPQMISGPLQGQLLALISHMSAPSHILEIGTFTGYATICLAQGLKDNGKITTIESNKELKALACKYFKLAEIDEMVQYISGDARKLVKTLPGPFDLVFIDAGKQDYAYYFDVLYDKVKSGGIFLVDNTLWSGKVTSNKKDKDTETMDAFNKKIAKDSRLEVVILPIRDGFTIIRKIL